VQVCVLGPICVVDDAAAPLDVTSPTQRLLLSALVADLGRVVTAERLVQGIWGDGAPASARQSLRSQVSRLRHVVGEALAGEGDGYVLRLPSDAVDATRFEEVLERARRAAATPDQLADALASWRGRAYGELADHDLVRLDAQRLELARLEALQLLAEHLLAGGRAAEAIDVATELVAADDVREPAWVVLVRALTAAGRPVEATRAHRRAVDALAAAGFGPGEALRAAEIAALRGDAPSVPRPPRPAVELVGRDADRARVEAVLTTGRLVTIVGPGGVGKTALASDVAHRLASRFRCGARIVELARVTDPPSVGASISTTLQFATTAGTDPLAHAGGLDALVVLDNCEHVVDVVAELVPRLLGGGDRLRVIATSREPLAVAGEHLVRLDPLGTDGADAPARQLFEARAREAAPQSRIAWTGRDADAVDRIVRRLDGLPLALEMAAARLTTMTPGELADVLEAGLDVLRSRRRDVAARHRSVTDVVAWSEALLDDRARTALEEVSVFAGPVDARAVDCVVAGGVDAVGELVERSLVVADTRGSATMFHTLSTVRAFARRRLREAGRADEVQRRHAEWAADELRAIDAALRTADEAEATTRFAVLFDELRAAHVWAREHEPPVAAVISYHAYCASRHLLRTEVTAWTHQLVDHSILPDPWRARMLAVLGGGLVITGRLAEAAPHLSAAAEALDGDVGVLHALDGLADLALFEGRLEDALAMYRRMTEVAASWGDALYFDLARVGTALALAYGGRVDAALDAVSGPPAGPAPSSRAWLHYARGEVLLEADPVVAARELDAAMREARTVDSRYIERVASVSAASVVARTGDPLDAIDAFASVVERDTTLGDTVHLVTTLRNLVPLLVRIDEPAAAAELYGAVAGDGVQPTYGAEAARLADAAAQARAVLGDAAFEAAASSGEQAGPWVAAQTVAPLLAARRPARTSQVP
jgi:predicted ATPase/DNA-binding SARP family transcriptional activator